MSAPTSQPATRLEHFAFSNPGRLTLAILVVCLAVALVTLVGSTEVIGLRLYGWGAKVNAEIRAGQWWRLLASAFLHGNWMHFLFNAYALFVVGSLVERAYGPVRFLAIYVGSALTGSLASFALSDAMSVGASGAIFGLMSAGLLALKRGDQSVQALLSGKQLAGLGWWAAYSLLQGFTHPGIDNAAHLGGLAGGAALAAVLPTGAPARVLAAVSLVALGWTATQVTQSVAGVPRLLAYQRGLRATDAGDFATAEREYTAALPLPEARLNRVVVRIEEGNTRGALADADTLLAAHPTGETLALGHLNRAVALLELRRSEEALRDASAALASADTDTRLRASLLRSEALLQLRRYDEALAQLDSTALAVDSGLAFSTLTQRARILVLLGRHRAAATAYRAAAGRQRDSPLSWYNAHLEHLAGHQVTLALQALDSAIAAARREVARTNDRDRKALRDLAMVLEASGRDSEAAVVRGKAEGRPSNILPLVP